MFEGEKRMTLEQIKKQDRVLDYFIQLAQIPSPSLKEDKVAQQIMSILNSKNIIS